MNLSIICGLFVTVGINIFLSHLVTPRPEFIWRRPVATTLVEIATWLFCFSVCLLLFRRIYFVSIGLISLELLLVLVNQAKFDSMKEVFLYQDFEYFIDMIKYPRLYLPFFGVWRVVFASGVFILAVLVSAIIESPVIFSAISTECLFFIIVSILIIKYLVKALPKIKLNPNIDMHELGQIAFFWAYWYAEKTTEIDYSNSVFVEKNKLQPSVDEFFTKDILVIQSESFFDARGLARNINEDVLVNFDEICTNAIFEGKVKVPAFGANTIRTESGFLTGLTESNLGVHKFNPYRTLSKLAIPNIAAYLKSMGYYTICIHPFLKNFYRRDKVFPLMGFDEFIDIKNFNNDKNGQYISDLAVTEKIGEVLLQHNTLSQPLFIFVMTMENHGPLHLEKPIPSDYQNFTNEVLSEDLSDLAVYLKHLKNADVMVKNLKTMLCERSSKYNRNSLFCWYGDHVPIMSKVYDKLGIPDGLTNFFLWSTKNNKDVQPVRKDKIHIHDLSKLIIEYC